MDVIKDCWHKEVRIYDHLNILDYVVLTSVMMHENGIIERSACSGLKDIDVEWLVVIHRSM